MMKDKNLKVSVENSQSFDQLSRILEISEGTFSFTVATYHTLAIRNKAINTIQGQRKGIAIVRINDAAVPILNQVKDNLNDETAAAIFVVDIENLVGSEHTNIDLINDLNVSRESWKQHFQCPVIFWMPEYLTTIVSKTARDFWSWVSHRIEFTGEESVSGNITNMQSISTDNDYSALISSMSYEDLTKRQAELEQWLADYSNDEKMQAVVIRRTNELASIYHHTAQFQKAEPLCKRVLEIDEAALGKDHPEVATDLNNLAGLYYATNRLTEAEPLYKRALGIDEASFGKDHPNVATGLNNLAELYRTTNRLAEAEPLYKRAIVIDEAAFGKEHPTVARDLNNLAELYRATNRLTEAEPLYKRAIEIYEAAFGKEHPNVATGLNNLAGVYSDTNRLTEAEPLYKRALEIDEAAFGKKHPDVARDLNNLAVVYYDTNRLTEAEPLYKRALEIDEAAFGKEHPNVATDLNNLAELYRNTNRLMRAESLYRRTLEILSQFTRKTGHKHPHLDDVINNYGILLMEMGRSREEADEKIRGIVKGTL